MTRLDKIIIPIAGDLLQYEKEFKAALDSEVKLINSVSNYLIKNFPILYEYFNYVYRKICEAYPKRWR